MDHTLLCADTDRTNARPAATLDRNPHSLDLVYVGGAQIRAVGKHNRFWIHVMGHRRSDAGVTSPILNLYTSTIIFNNMK